MIVEFQFETQKVVVLAVKTVMYISSRHFEVGQPHVDSWEGLKYWFPCGCHKWMTPNQDTLWQDQSWSWVKGFCLCIPDLCFGFCSDAREERSEWFVHVFKWSLMWCWWEVPCCIGVCLFFPLIDRMWSRTFTDREEPEGLVVKEPASYSTNQMRNSGFMM